MNDFTASNGATVETITSGRVIVRDATPFEYPDGTTRAGQSSYLDPGQFVALREFFQAEADERLGRWRWPENPDYVVYPKEHDLVEVMHEPTGLSLTSTVGGNAPFEDMHAQAARAYFDAHPEPKPWHDAKPWETWVVTIGGVEAAVTLDEDREFRDIRRPSQNAWCLITDEDITDARRIWPEVAS